MYVSPDIIRHVLLRYLYGLTAQPVIMVFIPSFLDFDYLESCTLIDSAYCTPYLHSACVHPRKWSQSEYLQNRIRIIRYVFFKLREVPPLILLAISCYILRRETSRLPHPFWRISRVISGVLVLQDEVTNLILTVCARIIAQHIISRFTHSHVCSCARSWEDSVWGDPLQKAFSLVPEKFSLVFNGTKSIFINIHVLCIFLLLFLNFLYFFIEFTEYLHIHSCLILSCYNIYPC